MSSTQIKTAGVLAAVVLSSLFAYQNCAPAKLTGDTQASENGSSGQTSTVGMKVDLAALAAAPAESSANLIYPGSGVVREAFYALGSPIIENLILKTNDFSRIEWVQQSTATVLSNGVDFQIAAASSDLSGSFLIYGYRNSSAYFLGQLKITNRPSSATSVNANGAVQISQKTISSDASTESILVQVETPNVDVTSLQFTVMQTGQTFSGKRAYLLQKKKTESVDLNVTVRDQAQGVFTITYNYPAKAAAPATVHVRTRVNQSSMMDAPDGNNGTAVHLWEAYAGPNQDFQFTSAGELKVHGKCLRPANNSQGSSIVVDDCNGMSAQLWVYDQASGALKSSNGFCLDLANSEVTNGTNIVLWGCHGALNQQWDLVP